MVEDFSIGNKCMSGRRKEREAKMDGNWIVAVFG